MSTMQDKWVWKMWYCKKHGLPPAQPWAWDEAESAWEEMNKNARGKVPKKIS